GDALAGRGGLMLISGPAGIGKTRLALELAAIAREQSFEVHWGRCLEVAGAPPFLPWTELTRSLARDLDAEDQRVLAQAFPAAGADTPPPPPLDADSARVRMFQTLARALDKRATGRAVALFLDDLHRADLSSLELLGFIAGSV